MFSRKKNKEKNKEIVGNNGQSKSSTSVMKVEGNTTVQRSVMEVRTSYISTSSTSSSVITSENRLVSNFNNGNLQMNESISSNFPESISRPRFRSLHEVDAKSNSTPYNLETGYKSPFSRTLTPYQSVDAKSFNPRTELFHSPSSNTLSPQSNFTRNSPSNYSSRQPAIQYSTGSTQSLPVISSEAHNHSPIVPTYKTDGKKRGIVLIINNIKFLKEAQERKGAELDEKNLKTLFKGMGFEVEIDRNLKQSEMLNRVSKFKNQSSLKSFDMSFVIMMSHGSNEDRTGNAVQGGFTQIFGIDDKGLPIDEVLNLFSTENCKAMAGKPKIFIFQCCRGTGSETLHYDARPIQSSIKTHADMLIAFSTLPGFYSIRDIKQGSWYIQSICDVFKQHANSFDLETLLKIVDDELSKKHPEYKQTSTYESRGFKRCYLRPK